MPADSRGGSRGHGQLGRSHIGKLSANSNLLGFLWTAIGGDVEFAKSDVDSVRTATVLRNRQIVAGALRGIIHQAGLTPDELNAL